MDVGMGMSVGGAKALRARTRYARRRRQAGKQAIREGRAGNTYAKEGRPIGECEQRRASDGKEGGQGGKR